MGTILYPAVHGPEDGGRKQHPTEGTAAQALVNSAHAAMLHGCLGLAKITWTHSNESRWKMAFDHFYPFFMGSGPFFDVLLDPPAVAGLIFKATEVWFTASLDLWFTAGLGFALGKVPKLMLRIQIKTQRFTPG